MERTGKARQGKVSTAVWLGPARLGVVRKGLANRFTAPTDIYRA